MLTWSSIFILLFCWFVSQEKTQASPWKPPRFLGPSIWILIDYCIFIPSAIWAFTIHFCLTCYLRPVTQNSSPVSKACCSWIFWFQHYHMFEKARQLPDFQLASRSLQWVISGNAASLLFPLLLHSPAVTPLILYGQLPQWPWVGAEGTLSNSLKRLPMTTRSLILGPWSLTGIIC